MLNMTQKRRNFSKDPQVENKFQSYRQYEKYTGNNHFTPSMMLKQRSLNRPLLPNKLSTSQSEECIFKKKNLLSPMKFNQQMSALDTKFSSLSNKIKDLLKTEDGEDSKQNKGNSRYSNLVGSEKLKELSPMRKSQVLKPYREVANHQYTNDKISNNLPYFIQCLKRKSSINTEAYLHIHTSIQTYKQFIKQLSSVKPRSPDTKIAPQKQNRKTIVFDMDQTLIHTSEMMVKGYEIKVPFRTTNGKVSNGYVSVRPYAKQILLNLSKHFDIIVFTAGNQCYADPILDHIDPTRCIKHRLYRQSCTFFANQLFIKDLRVLGRNLENVVLVDNAPHSYMLQMGNGIPILNYIKGKEDDQLIKLQPYLLSLLEVDDVRKTNSETFRLHDYHRFQHHDKLVKDLYNKWF